MRLLAVLAAAVSLAACGGGKPSSLAVTGTVDFQAAGGWTKSSGVCDYSKPPVLGAQPLQITISNGSKIVAATSIAHGTLANSLDCIFRFKLTGVPAGAISRTRGDMAYRLVAI
jgi:hypothetical protein